MIRALEFQSLTLPEIDWFGTALKNSDGSQLKGGVKFYLPFLSIPKAKHFQRRVSRFYIF